MFLKRNICQQLFQQSKSSSSLVLQRHSVKTLSAPFAKDVDEICSHNDIPTPRRLPILGTTLDIIAAGSAKKFHEYVNKRHKELGPIFRETIESKECVFLCDAQMMREVFIHEGKHPRHPIPEAWLLYQQDQKKNKRGLLFMDGDEWLHHRKLMNHIFLSKEIELNTQQPIETASQELIERWMKQVEAGEDVIPNLESDMYKLSIEIMMNLMLGPSHVTKPAELQLLIDQFARDVHKIFKYSAQMFIAPPKLLKMIKSKAWTQFVEVVDSTLDLGHQITNYCLDNMQLERGGFLVKMREAGMEREYINRIFVDLIIAAGDTTAFSTLWAMYLLGKNPQTQQGIHAILTEHPNNKESCLMKGVIRETLRMFPVAPFIGRVLPEDSVIGNYKINKNTMVLLSLFTAGRDEDNFKEPDSFCPMRWDRAAPEFTKTLKPQASVPFAMGSRSCIGQRIANKQMYIFLSNVIEKFHLELLNDPEIEPILQMVTVPSVPIKLQLTPRQPTTAT